MGSRGRSPRCSPESRYRPRRRQCRHRSYRSRRSTFSRASRPGGRAFDRHIRSRTSSPLLRDRRGRDVHRELAEGEREEVFADCRDDLPTAQDVVRRAPRKQPLPYLGEFVAGHVQEDESFPQHDKSLAVHQVDIRRPDQECGSRHPSRRAFASSRIAWSGPQHVSKIEQSPRAASLVSRVGSNRLQPLAGVDVYSRSCCSGIMSSPQVDTK